MDFHIEYLSSKYFISAEELRCLSRALGYPTQILSTIFNVQGNETVSLSKVNSMMDDVKFPNSFNQTFNIYPSEWNRHAILTSILLLSYKSITFTNLNLARCIFNFYEKEDGHGLVLNKMHLLKYLQMCNRIISPMKLEHRLKHMHRRLYYPNRIQLWEFLELNLWSEVFQSMDRNNSMESSSGKENGLYQLSDDDISIVYTELKCFERENFQYIKEELTFPNGDFSRILRIIQRPLKNQFQSENTKMLRKQARNLSKQINQSNQMLAVAYGSCFKFSGHEVPSGVRNEKLGINRLKKCQSQMDSFRREPLFRPKSIIRPKTAPIVSTEDIETYKQKVQDCEKETKLLDSKYHDKLYLDMEYMRPGFWQRWMTKPRPHSSYLTQVNLIKVRKPSAEYLTRLSKPRSGTCSPLHKLCNQY